MPPNNGWGQLVRTGAQWLLARPGLYALPASVPFLRLGETIYHPPRRARAMSRASRAMLLANWQRALRETTIRSSRAQRLIEAALGSGKWSVPRPVAGGAPGFLRLPLVSTRDAKVLIGRQARRFGIMPGYPMPLSRLSGFTERCINAHEQFRGAERLVRTLITVPTHGLLSDADLAFLERWLVGT